MIAKVRIAPMERWCDLNRAKIDEYPDMAKWAGLWIEIEPGSMYVESGHKHWDLTREWYEKLWKIGRLPKWHLKEFTCTSICEHMLEMD